MTRRRLPVAVSMLGVLAVVALGTAGAAFASDRDERPLPAATSRADRMEERTERKAVPAEPRLGSSIGKRQRGFDVPPGQEMRPARGVGQDGPRAEGTPAPAPTGGVLGATPPRAAESPPVAQAASTGREAVRAPAAAAVNRRQAGPVRVIDFGPHIAAGERGAALGGVLGVVNIRSEQGAEVASTAPSSPVGTALLVVIVACQVLGAVVGTHLARRALGGPVVARRL